MVDVRNVISGTVYGDVVQAGRIDQVVLPVRPPEALGGLPAMPGPFVGRAAQAETLIAALRPTRRLLGGPVCIVTGLAGVGKTALAVHVAEQLLSKGWCQGVLFVDLHGYDTGGRVDPYAAMGAFLRAMGVDQRHVPSDREQRARLYWSELSRLSQERRRVLVVLDNAGDAGQVAPLLPGMGAHPVLVTSRHSLAEIAEAGRFDVGLLDYDESIALLEAALATSRAGDDRLADAPAARELVRHCGRLPLALTIVAAILVDDRQLPIRDLAAALRESKHRLDALAFGERTVRAAFDLSYQRLSPAEQRLFRLLALHPGPYVSREVAAALTGDPDKVVQTWLAALRRAHLVVSTEPGPAFAMHDLVRLYAADRAERDEPAESTRDALDRMFGHYRQMAEAAHRQIRQNAETERFPTRRDALRWLDTERLCLVNLARVGHDTGRDEDTIELTLHLRDFFDLRRHWDDWAHTHALALDCARRVGDRAVMGRLLQNLGDAFRAQWQSLSPRGQESQVRQLADIALDHYKEAQRQYAELNDRSGVADVTDRMMSIVGQSKYNAGEAVAHYDNAVRNYRASGDDRRLADALNNLGVSYVNLGIWLHTSGDLRHHLDQAAGCHSEARRLRRDLGAPRDEARSLMNLGNVHREAAVDTRRGAVDTWGTPDLDSAMRCYAEAAALFEAADDKSGRADALFNLGLAHLDAGNIRQARRYWQDAISAGASPNQHRKIRLHLAELHTVRRWRNRTLSRGLSPHGYLASIQVAAGIAAQEELRLTENRYDDAHQLTLADPSVPDRDVYGHDDYSAGRDSDGGEYGGGGDRYDHDRYDYDRYD